MWRHRRKPASRRGPKRIGLSEPMLALPLCPTSSEQCRHQSSAKASQRTSFVQGNVLGLVALDFILGIVLTRVMDISFVVYVFGVHAYDSATDPTGFGFPTDVITDLECPRHGLSSHIDGNSDRIARRESLLQCLIEQLIQMGRRRWRTLARVPHGAHGPVPL
jgi:hypothetical protein